MRENLTQTIEDYLKAIYEVTSTHERASTTQIAKKLGVTAASVTGMIKKLSKIDPPLLEYKRHRGVRLTHEGENVALEIIRHHRLLEMFLYQILGYEWDKVHVEADRLEHVISEKFEESIAQVLGNPSHDPHGDPIPTRELDIPKTPTFPLAKLQPGQTAMIHRVNSTDANLLRYLGKLGLMPQVQIIALEYSPYDQNLSVQVVGTDKTIVLGPKITYQIYIEVIENT